jgi:D-3-phosphoglycerate dehydrogenase
MARLVILHKNQPNMLSQVTSVLSADGVNIEHMASRSKGNYACALFDCCEAVTDAQVADIAAIDGIIRVLVK